MPVTESAKFTSNEKSSGPLATLLHPNGSGDLIVAWAGVGDQIIGGSDKGDINIAKIPAADLPAFTGLNLAPLPGQQLLKDAGGHVEKAFNTLNLVDHGGTVLLFWDGGGNHINGAALTGI